MHFQTKDMVSILHLMDGQPTGNFKHCGSYLLPIHTSCCFHFFCLATTVFSVISGYSSRITIAVTLREYSTSKLLIHIGFSRPRRTISSCFDKAPLISDLECRPVITKPVSGATSTIIKQAYIKIFNK